MQGAAGIVCCAGSWGEEASGGVTGAPLLPPNILTKQEVIMILVDQLQHIVDNLNYGREIMFHPSSSRIFLWRGLHCVFDDSQKR